MGDDLSNIAIQNTGIHLFEYSLCPVCTKSANNTANACYLMSLFLYTYWFFHLVFTNITITALNLTNTTPVHTVHNAAQTQRQRRHLSTGYTTNPTGPNTSASPYYANEG
jgi:hypothetical protein